MLLVSKTDDSFIHRSGVWLLCSTAKQKACGSLATVLKSFFFRGSLHLWLMVPWKGTSTCTNTLFSFGVQLTVFYYTIHYRDVKWTTFLLISTSKLDTFRSSGFSCLQKLRLYQMRGEKITSMVVITATSAFLNYLQKSHFKGCLVQSSSVKLSKISSLPNYKRKPVGII